MTNILCHIVGVNEEIKKYLKNNIKNKKNIILKDLEEFTTDIIDDENMNNFFNKYEYYNSQIKNENGKTNKNMVKKAKEIEKTMADFWKTKFEFMIENFSDKNNNKKIIFIGQNIYFKNKKVKVKIESKCKFFIKVNLLNNAKNIITYNLNNYKDDIINGDFPLEFLDIDFLVKKRTIMQDTYEKFGYILKSIKNIIKFIYINIDNDKFFTRIDKLYYGSLENLKGKILPIDKGRIISYPFEWLSIINIPKDANKNFIKGNFNNKPFIREIKKNGLKALDIPGYLYEVNKNTFAYHENGKKLKFISQNPIKFTNKLEIENILTLLENLNINIIKYKKK